MFETVKFFMNPPEEIRELKHLSLTSEGFEGSYCVEIENALEDTAAWLFTAFDTPRQKDTMKQKTWFFQPKNISHDVPIFCSNGIAKLLDCSAQFSYLFDCYLAVRDDTHIGTSVETSSAPYSVGDKLMKSSDSSGKNCKRRLFMLWFLDHQAHLEATISPLHMSRVFKQKQRGTSEPFSLHTNPIQVPTLQHFSESFLQANPGLQCTKSSFNRRFSVF
jgi:hypothetical protein